MKHLRLIVTFAYILISSNLLGQNKEALKWLQKLEEIQKTYDFGDYPETISKAEMLLKDLRTTTSEQFVYKTKANFFILKAHYSTLSFDQVSKRLPDLVKEIEACPTIQHKMYGYLYLIQYYNETRDFYNASMAFGALSSQLKEVDKSFAIELEFQRIVYLIGQKSLFSAKSILQGISDFTNSTPEAVLSKEETLIRYGKGFFKNKQDQVNSLKILNAHCLIANGNYAEAEVYFSSNKKILLVEAGRTSLRYTKFIELEAELAWLREEYAKSASLYKEAYEFLNTSDYHQSKINLLCKITCNSIFLNDITSFEQYMRRLQLHADRSIYKYNYFQLALGFSDAYRYFSNSDYELAQRKIEKISKAYLVLPPNHFFRYQLLDLSRQIQEETGLLAKRRELLDTLVGLSARYMGTNSNAYLESKLLLANHQLSAGETVAPLEKEISDLYANSTIYFTKDSLSLLNFKLLNFYSRSAFLKDRFLVAKENSDKAKRLAVVLFGSNSWENTQYAIAHIEYALMAGNYKEALEDYQLLPEFEKNIVAKNNTYQYSLFCSKGYVASLLGDISSRTKYSLKALQLFQSERKKHRPEFLPLQEQAAATYIESSNIILAEKLLSRSLNWKKEKLGNDHPDLLSVYKELTLYYLAIGNFGQADKTINEYIRICKIYFTTSSSEYAVGLALWGQYHASIGDLYSAKINLEECLKVQLSVFGDKSIQVAKTYLELAKVSTQLNPERFSENEAYYSKAGAIIKNSLGTFNQFHAYYLQLSAEFYITYSKYDIALDNLSSAEFYWKSMLGNSTIHSAEIKSMFGKIAYLKSNYSEAEIFYLEARKIYESVLSEAHPAYASITADLAKVYYMEKKTSQALEMMELCIPKYLAYVEKYFPSLSFQEKSKFWFSMKPEFEFYNFLILSNSANSKTKQVGNVYNNIIATKALLLSSDIKLRKQITSSGDTLLIRLFEEWVAKRELITSTLSYSKEQLSQQGIEPKQLELQLEQLEKSMGERSEIFQGKTKSITPKWGDIKAALTSNEFVVEIVRYRYFDKVFKDSILYSALLIDQKSKEGPELINFENGKNMEGKWMVYNSNAVIFNIEDMISYNNYWLPIKKKIPDGALVYLSSDGVFNQLNIETLLNPGTLKFVIDENQIVQVTNTKDILADQSSKQLDKKKATTAQEGLIVLCGNPKFYLKAESPVKKTIPNLKGAENEVIGLDSIVKKFSKPDLVLLNDEIIEDSLVQIKNPRVLHVASHGYFKESSDKAEGVGANPLLNSGLLLSGAGDIIDNKENNYVNSAPGILTAYEVTNMTLDKTEIVVLSACETGRGKVQAGEGVYGLQRSFLVAGANCVILSLFKVNDEVTKELMKQFYSNWLKTNDKRTAFVDAKKTIKERYKFPIFWGAFIMIEGKAQRKHL